MEWTGPGIILGTRRHGESSVIVELFTPERGRHMGLVRGGRSKRWRSVLQPGNRVTATWRARLEDHLGQFTFEPEQLDAAAYMADPLCLAALNALDDLVRLLPERDPHTELYAGYVHILDKVIAGHAWAKDYVFWEFALLQELGFGLDLTSCAATGETGNLTYVSPKSGRAVSAAAGEPYKAKLLKLPPFLLNEFADPPDWPDLEAGLYLTGYFLRRHVYEPRGLPIPESRDRAIRLLAEQHS